MPGYELLQGSRHRHCGLVITQPRRKKAGHHSSRPRLAARLPRLHPEETELVAIRIENVGAIEDPGDTFTRRSVIRRAELDNVKKVPGLYSRAKK